MLFIKHKTFLFLLPTPFVHIILVSQTLKVQLHSG
jgi:hypothetical protein